MDFTSEITCKYSVALDSEGDFLSQGRDKQQLLRLSEGQTHDTNLIRSASSLETDVSRRGRGDSCPL